MAAQVKCDHLVIAGEKGSYELPVQKRAPQAVQKDDACTRATEVAYGELHSAGIHNEICRVVRQGGRDRTTSRRVAHALPEPITEFNAVLGTRDDNPVSRSTF
jgi:hypothetical protein